MYSINMRIKEIRKKLNLTQTKLGEIIGVTKSRVSAYENDEEIPERAIKTICKELNINYFWLTEGRGDMFTAIPETILDEVVDEFKLDKNDRVIIESYLDLNKDERKVVKEFLLNIAAKTKKDEN